MRKLLLFLIFSGIFFFGSYGQEIQIFNSQNIQIPNNSVIQVYGNHTDMQIISLFGIKNSSLKDISLSVTKEVIQNADGSDNSFYWGSKIEKNETPTNTLSLAPDQLIEDFSTVYNPNFSKGTSLIRYSFFDTNNPHITTTITIEYITNGINESAKFKPELTLSDAYPNPAESMVYFDYTLPGNIFEAKIIIRTLLGSIVAESYLKADHGKEAINVEELIEGIYFYSLMVGSDIKLTKKLIVKH